MASIQPARNDHNSFIPLVPKQTMPREILVVKKEALFEGEEFLGFMPVEKKDFSKNILSNFEYKERTDELEYNFDFQQIIPYIWIINPKTKQVFAYRRAPDTRYDEARLRDKWSGGIGGHIDKENPIPQDPIELAALRELQEEVVITGELKLKLAGFINSDIGSVEKAHFGVAYLVETEDDVKKGDDEMTHGQFYSLEEMEKIFGDPNNQIEAWTQISWPFVKKYLTSLPNQ